MHSQQGGPRFFLAYILPALILLFSDTELTRHPQQVPTELSITGDSVHLWDASYPTRQRISGPKSGHTVPRETAPYRHRVPSAHCMEPETEITTEYGGEGCFPWSWRVAETGIESADLERETTRQCASKRLWPFLPRSLLDKTWNPQEKSSKSVHTCFRDWLCLTKASTYHMRPFLHNYGHAVTGRNVSLVHLTNQRDIPHHDKHLCIVSTSCRLMSVACPKCVYRRYNTGRCKRRQT